MTPIEELKALEAHRHNRLKSGQWENLFTTNEAEDYRRLALEIAAIAENATNTADYFARISEIIFSPSDPRVVVGREYEFSNSWDFRAPETAVLVEVNKYGDDEDFPFCFMDDNGAMPCRVFIRELPKEERG